MAEERRHISQLNLLTPAAGDLLMVQDISEGTGAGADAYKRLPLSAVGILSLAQTWTAVQTFSAGVVASSFLTGLVTLSPNTATTITPPKTTVCLLIYPHTGGSDQHYALAVLRTDIGAVQSNLLAGSATAVTTGVLTGTTGQNNFLTIAAHSDGKIYVENRRGISLTLHYVLFG